MVAVGAKVVQAMRPAGCCPRLEEVGPTLALRTVVAASQISVGMWRWNGSTADSQVRHLET